MRLRPGRVIEGPFGSATEVLWDAVTVADWGATLATWFLDCPGQSPAWRHYGLSIIHLRPIEGESKPATIRIPHATHEVLLVAYDPYDPELDPRPDDVETWRFLMPVNVMEQIELPSDQAAVELLELCARAVVNGILPAEPMLAGAVEPWRTVLLRTAAHLRGEEHAS